MTAPALTLADLDRLEALRARQYECVDSVDGGDAMTMHREHAAMLREHEAELIALARQALQPVGDKEQPSGCGFKWDGDDCEESCCMPVGHRGHHLGQPQIFHAMGPKVLDDEKEPR